MKEGVLFVSCLCLCLTFSCIGASWVRPDSVSALKLMSGTGGTGKLRECGVEWAWLSRGVLVVNGNGGATSRRYKRGGWLQAQKGGDKGGKDMFRDEGGLGGQQLILLCL